MVGLVVLFSIGLGLALPQPAHAQLIVHDPLQAIKNALNRAGDLLQKAYDEVKKVNYSIAFKNAMRVFLGKVAEDTAVWVSSAGTGQKPLFITDPHYWTNLSDAAAGDFLDSISSEVFGTSLCEPLDVQKKVQLELATRNLVNPLTPCQNDCNATYTKKQEALQRVKLLYVDPYKTAAQQSPDKKEGCQIFKVEQILGFPGPFPEENPIITYRECYDVISQRYNTALQTAAGERDQCLNQCVKKRRKSACSATAVWNNINDIQEFGIQVQTFFEPEQNDIGQLLTLYGLAQQKQAEEVEAQQTIQESKLGAITAKVSGDILTPGSLVQEKAAQPINESSKIETTQTGSLIADTVGIFTNTLTQRLMERFFKGKCGLNPAACKGPGQTESRLGSLLFSNAPSGIAAARLQFSSLAKIDYTIGDPSKSQVAVSDRLVADGIINSGFQQAIDEKKTLREAIEDGLINANTTFGFDESNAEAANGLPYRSILYLRKYRVVPVGWELAALYIRDNSDQSYGLKELMDLYDDCGQNGDASEFCGLIDPGWVLKAPQTYCRRQGSGDEIISRQFVCDADTNGDGKINCSSSSVVGGDLGSWVIQRNSDTCVDEPNCVKEDAQGNCLAYGYCFEEKPTWNFGGESCPGYYASCRTYTDSNALAVAYLKDTIDTSNCTAETAGCQAYCPEVGYNAVDQTWNCRADSGHPDYFDRDAAACSAGNAGCREFTKVTAGTNVLSNASFEYYEGTIDDGAADKFGRCSDNGAACGQDSDCSSIAACLGWKGSDGTVLPEAVTTDNSGVGNPNQTAAEVPALGGASYLLHDFDAYQPLNGLTLTFSFYGKATGGSCDGQFGVRSRDGAEPGQDQTASFSGIWQRYAATFTLSEAPANPYSQTWVQAYLKNIGCAVRIDNAKLEIGNALTVYTDYQTANSVSLKLPDATLLTNGDFSLDDGADFFDYPAPVDLDDATAANLIPDGWQTNGGAVEIDQTVGHLDRSSVKLTAASSQSRVGQLVPVEYGQTYEVSGWVKTELTPAGGRPFGTIMTECVYGSHAANPYSTLSPDPSEPASCLLANLNTTVRPSFDAGDNEFAITGSHDWTYVRYTLTANNPDISYLRVLCANIADNANGINGTGNGNVWCDDVKVVKNSYSCMKSEVGCQKYTAAGTRTTVNGVIRSSDMCPADQVGCGSFKEVAITSVPQRPENDPVYFTEASGEQCTASQVGCEEYTNLDKERAGGEALEYYKSIRLCVKPTDPNAQSYYTWEGSEENGYQLRSHRLLESDSGGAPCTNLSVEASGVEPVCQDSLKGAAACSLTETATNPDCREYYDSAGLVYYVLQSRTITASDDCHPYRNTIDQAAGSDLIYYVLPSQSVSCPASGAGCRQYKGTTAAASRTVFSDTFENGTVGSWTGGSYSNESVNLNGHSMRTETNQVFGINLSSVVRNGAAYSLKFWYKPRAAGKLAFQITDGALNKSTSPTIDITAGDWAQYELGPLFLNLPSGTTQFVLEFTAPVGETLPGGWLDNVSLIESVDSIYRIKGTSTSCDPANVGCTLYTDSSGQANFIKSFSGLCSERAVGCRAAIDVQNSDYPLTQKVRESPDVWVGPDQTLAYVATTKNTCSQEQTGCSRYGTSTLDASGQPISWQTAYILNDPDTYATTRCGPENEDCDEYTENISGSKVYFRNPGNQTCEYRTSANYKGQLVSGWFITGSSTPCPSISLTCRSDDSALAGQPCVTQAQQSACLQSGGYCFAYPLDGEEKQVDLVCAGTCTGGATPGAQCTASSDCANVCDNDPSKSCVSSDDCSGGSCSIGACANVGYCDGRSGLAMDAVQKDCVNNQGSICVASPQVGQPAKVCVGGTDPGVACLQDDDCAGGGTCSAYWVGVCDKGSDGCTEFRDPLDPAPQPNYPNGCNVNCTLATDENGNNLGVNDVCAPLISNGTPGCTPYYLLRQGLADQTSECNGQIDFDIGCQPFFDTENPIANFVGG